MWVSDLHHKDLEFVYVRKWKLNAKLPLFPTHSLLSTPDLATCAHVTPLSGLFNIWLSTLLALIP